MRALVLLLTLLTTTFATQLSIDGIEDLFKKYVKNELSEPESQQLQDVIDILHRPEHISRANFEDAPEFRTIQDYFGVLHAVSLPVICNVCKRLEAC